MSYARRYDVGATINKNTYHQYQMKNNTERQKNNSERNQYNLSKPKKNIISYEQNSSHNVSTKEKSSKNSQGFQYGDRVFNKYSNSVMSFVGVAKNDCLILCNISEQTLNIIPKKYVVSYKPQKNFKSKSQISPKRTPIRQNISNDDDDDDIIIIT